MEAVQTVSAPSFDTVWALVKEVAENQKETDRQMKETDRQMKETDRQIKETDRQMKETDRQMKETDRQMKETDRKLHEIGKRFGDFTNSFGNVVEYMVAPNLQDKFREFGLDFQMVGKDIKIRDHKNGIKFEIDIFLENNDAAMLVEIKADLAISDINKHMARLEKMRKFADLRGDKRIFLGAVAGISIPEKAKEYALAQGFYLIEPTGEDFCIIPPYNKPKEW